MIQAVVREDAGRHDDTTLDDLRVLALATVADGLNHRQAEVRFGVSAANITLLAP